MGMNNATSANTDQSHVSVDPQKPVSTGGYHSRKPHRATGDSTTQPVSPAPKSPEPGA